MISIQPFPTSLSRTEVSSKNINEESNIKIKSNNILTEKKVLFVDDEEACRISGKLILQSLGMIVTIADGGNEALEIFQNSKNFDLIIIDLMMPEIDGIELISKIKSIPELIHIPIILQTGTSEQETIDLAKNLGACNYILKPYNKEIMLNVIIESINK